MPTEDAKKFTKKPKEPEVERCPKCGATGSDLNINGGKKKCKQM